MTYENMMTPRLFEPLGMSSSMVGTSRTIVTTRNVAKPIICKDHLFVKKFMASLMKEIMAFMSM